MEKLSDGILADSMSVLVVAAVIGDVYVGDQNDEVLRAHTISAT